MLLMLLVGLKTVKVLFVHNLRAHRFTSKTCLLNRLQIPTVILSAYQRDGRVDFHLSALSTDLMTARICDTDG